MSCSIKNLGIKSQAWQTKGKLVLRAHALVNSRMCIHLIDEDHRWFVDTPRDIAMHRIANRHVTAKIENTLEAAKVRAETNDLPNGDYIRDNLIEPDVVIHNY